MQKLILIGLMAVISGCTTPNTAPIIVWPSSATIRVAETLKLEATYANEITGWVSSDTTIASVQNGIVVGLKVGQANVHAISESTPSGDAQITVIP